MKRVVAIGECMVEMAPQDVSRNFHMGFAGDTLNTAWYLRGLLGASDRVDYLTAVGTDAVSDQMVAFIKAAKIGTNHVVRRDSLTVGLYMIQLQAGERSFIYWRDQSAARTLARDGSLLDQALSGADMAYFSGITLAILPDDARATLLQALSRFRTGGGTVVFDPNLRPKLWRHPDDMMASVMNAAAQCDMILPSFEDEATWFGDREPLATVERYAGQGASVVVVKNGPHEILSCTNGMVNHHDPDPVEQVVDTTAAGDSFNAAFLAGHLEGHPLDRAIKSGSALAAKVIQRPGALVDTTR